MSAELLQKLRLAQADPSEAESLLTSHFGNSQTLDNVVSFQRSGANGLQGPDVLRLHFGSTRKTFGKIVDVEPGPAFDDADVPLIAGKVDTHLLATSEREITRRVLFSLIPVTGAYRYRDSFQILPAPSTSPQPRNKIIDHQPFLLEVAYTASLDRSVGFARAHRAEHETELLLCLLLDPSVWGNGRNTTYQWAQDDWADSPQTVFARVGYPTPPPAFGPAFATIDAFDPLKRKDANAYYFSLGIEATSVLELPSIFDTALDAYYALDTANKETFLRACYWFAHSKAIGQISKSASFIAMVSGIEAIMPPPSQTRCTTCGGQTGLSGTQRFAAFVDGLVPDATEADDRKEFYRLRSALAHGGKLLKRDEDAWGMGYAGVGEFWQSDRLSRVVRIALINWLLLQNRELS